MRDLLCALICVLSFSISNFVEAQSNSIEHAIEQLNRRQKTVESVYYRAEGTVTFPANTVRYPNGQVYEIWESQESKPISLVVLVDFEQPRYRIAESVYLARHSKDSRERIVGFSRRNWVHAYESGVWIRWDVDEQAEILRNDDNAPRIYHKDWPFFVSLGYIPWHRSSPRSFHHPLEIDDFLDRLEQIHNGKRCIIFRTCTMNPLPRYHELWIDPDNWNVVRDDQWDMDKVRSTIEMEYRHENGRSILDSFQLKTFYHWQNAPVRRVYDYRITEFALNPDYESLCRDFDIQYGVSFEDK